MSTPTPANKGQDGHDQSSNWVEYRRLVLSELERFNQDMSRISLQITSIQLNITQSLSDTRSLLTEKLRETTDAIERSFENKVNTLDVKYHNELRLLSADVAKNESDIAALKAKSAMLGAVAGFVVALAGVLISAFIKH